MVILHVAGLSGNKSAGPTINVPKNVQYGNEYADVALYNCYNNKLETFIDQDKIYLMNDYQSLFDLPKPFNRPDIIVFQSMYIKEFIKIYKQAKKMNIPYIIVPRGCLTKSAQNKKKFKKKLGNIIFFNKFVKDAAAINFLTQNEYEESNSFKINDYFINGNGVELKEKHKDFSKKKDKFIVNFIGRIEWYHKGLDYLLEAINIGQKEFRKYNYEFNLYGPDDFGSYKKLNNMIEEFKIGDLISIKEPVYGKEKEIVYLNSDLFIHTSRLEGQPTSVIDAISYGIPVLVTPGTNISEVVLKNKLGFVSKLNSIEIYNKLLEAYKSNKQLTKISQKEIEYSKNNFEWNTIVKTNISFYNKYTRKIQ